MWKRPPKMALSPQHSQPPPAPAPSPIRPKRAHRGNRISQLAAVLAPEPSALTSWPTRSQSQPHPRGLGDLGPINVVLQPIVNVTTGVVYATEALARFPEYPDTPVD